MEELRSRLTGAEKLDTQESAAPTKSQSLSPNGVSGSEKPSHRAEAQRDVDERTERSESKVSNGVRVCLWSLRSSENTFAIDAWVLLGFSFFFA